MSSASQPRRRGRPLKGTARMFYEGELHALLVEKLPQFVHFGRIDTAEFSEAIGLSTPTVHRWMLADRISSSGAWRLRWLSAGHITEGDLLPFLA